jgi:hypothetical protein
VTVEIPDEGQLEVSERAREAVATPEVDLEAESCSRAVTLAERLAKFSGGRLPFEGDGLDKNYFSNWYEAGKLDTPKPTKVDAQLERSYRVVLDEHGVAQSEEFSHMTIYLRYRDPADSSVSAQPFTYMRFQGNEVSIYPGGVATAVHPGDEQWPKVDDILGRIEPTKPVTT